MGSSGNLTLVYTTTTATKLVGKKNKYENGIGEKENSVCVCACTCVVGVHARNALIDIRHKRHKSVTSAQTKHEALPSPAEESLS